MDTVVPMLLLAMLLAFTWYLVWWALGRQARAARRQRGEDGREGVARQSGVSRSSGDKASVAFFATLTVLVGVLVWTGVRGHLPDWLLWVATVL